MSCLFPGRSLPCHRHKAAELTFFLHTAHIIVVLLKSALTTITLKGTLGCPLCDGSMPAKAQKDVCESVHGAAANFFSVCSHVNSRKHKRFFDASAVALSIREARVLSRRHCLAHLLVLFWCYRVKGTRAHTHTFHCFRSIGLSAFLTLRLWVTHILKLYDEYKSLYSKSPSRYYLYLEIPR